MKEYIEQLHRYCDQHTQAAASSLGPGLSVDEVISVLLNTNQNAAEAHFNIEQLLKNHVNPLLEDYRSLSDEDEQDLFDVAQRLSSFTMQLDPGLALQIYEALLARSRELKNDTGILKYLYWCGLTAYYLRLPDMNKTLDYFLEGAAYYQKYDSLADVQSRQYVHRCLGNCSMMAHLMERHDDAYDMEERAFAFWNELLLKGKDRDFPWIAYFMSVLTHRRTHISMLMHDKPQNMTKEDIRRNLDIALQCAKLSPIENENYTDASYTDLRNVVYLWETQLVAGLINFDQFSEKMKSMQHTCAPDNFSQIGFFKMIQLNSYIMFYAAQLMPHDDETRERMNLLCAECNDYLTRIPPTIDPVRVSANILLYVKNARDYLPSEDYLPMILKTTTYRHIPTYAHSILVREIARVITAALLDTRPETFIGMWDIKTASDAMAKREALLSFAAEAGLCHDVGKIEYVCNPSFFMRELSPGEKAIVQKHSRGGYDLLSPINRDGSLSGLLDVILGHHRYYDGNGGYPEDFDNLSSPVKPIIDIISVADSLDAATDDIGTAHMKPLSLKAVIKEIDAQKGTRYSPVIAELLLTDKALHKKIDTLLKTHRKEAYYQAYCHSTNALTH